MLAATFAATALKSSDASLDTKLELDAMTSALEGDTAIPAKEEVWENRSTRTE